MVSNVIFFEKEEELEKITGKTSGELEKLGFNLNAMDWGFVCDDKWDDSSYYGLNPQGCYKYHTWRVMEFFRIEYQEIEYCGKWYYTIHLP